MINQKKTEVIALVAVSGGKTTITSRLQRIY